MLWYEGPVLTNRRFLSADERGSITAVTNDAGAVLGRNAFDTFGAPAPTNLGLFGYAGQPRLPGGLWNLRARAYHPALGRFLQPDPIGMAGGMNLYAYAGNDPVNFVDPWGLQAQGAAGGSEVVDVVRNSRRQSPRGAPGAGLSTQAPQTYDDNENAAEPCAPGGDPIACKLEEPFGNMLRCALPQIGAGVNMDALGTGGFGFTLGVSGGFDPRFGQFSFSFETGPAWGRSTNPISFRGYVKGASLQASSPNSNPTPYVSANINFNINGSLPPAGGGFTKTIAGTNPETSWSISKSTTPVALVASITKKASVNSKSMWGRSCPK